MLTQTTIREENGPQGPTVTIVTSRPSLVQRIVFAILIVVGAAIGAVILLPLVIAGACILLVFAVIRAMVRIGARAGRDDGRRNVRVVSDRSNLGP